MNFLKLALISLVLSFSLSVQSYTIFSLEEINWNNTREVDVLIAGHGPEMGGMFAMTALTMAASLAERSPSYRAQVIFWVKESSIETHREFVESRDHNIILINDESLTLNKLEFYLLTLPMINSFHVYSHSNAWAGMILQSSGNRLNAETFDWEAVRPRFTDDSYLFFHGCSNAFTVVPEISKAIERPAFGSTTSTDFQRLYTDKNWYHHNVGQFPKDMRTLGWNDLLFNSRVPCWKGFCQRMKPNNHPYRGIWGDFETGLPFYKPFCNYGENSPTWATSDCLHGIANALRDWPADPRLSDAERVVDFLCPSNPGYGTNERCRRLLLEGREQNDIFWGKTPYCTLTGCDYWLDNSENSEGTPRRIFNSVDHGNLPFQIEFELLMIALGFEG